MRRTHLRIVMLLSLIALVGVLAPGSANAEAPVDETPPIVTVDDLPDVVDVGVEGNRPYTPVVVTYSAEDESPIALYAIRMTSRYMDTVVSPTGTSYEVDASRWTSAVCFQVSATDSYGNHSPYSAPQCVTPDRFPPRNITPTFGLASIDRAARTATMKFSARSTDDVGVVSYSHRVSVAALGATPAWTLAPGDSPDFSVTAAVGKQICVDPRAVDVFGKAVEWGGATACLGAPLDDSMFALRGGSRVVKPGAAGGGATLLKGSARLAKAHWTTRTVAVRGWCSPTGGFVTIRNQAGRRTPGVLRFRSREGDGTGWCWDWVAVPVGTRAISLRRVAGSSPSLIDAIAPIRDGYEYPKRWQD